MIDSIEQGTVCPAVLTFRGKDGFVYARPCRRDVRFADRWLPCEPPTPDYNCEVVEAVASSHRVNDNYLHQTAEKRPVAAVRRY